MKKLSLERINKSASYDVIEGDHIGSLIIRNDNPRLSDVLSEFAESVSLLSQKPDSE